MHSKHSSERGFALLVALWLLILISLICAGILLVAREVGRRSASDVDTIRAQLLADAAVNEAIYDLLAPAAGRGITLNGIPQTISVLDHAVEIDFASEAGKLSLNDVSASQISAIFEAEGLSVSEANELANHIVGWRSHLINDQRDRETEEYQAAGRTYGPRFDQFHSVGELRLVLGMTDVLMERAEPLFTIWSHATTIDRSVASERLLGDLAGTDDKLAASELLARQSGNSNLARRGPSIGEVITIHAKASLTDTFASRTAVVQISGDNNDPYQVLEWK